MTGTNKNKKNKYGTFFYDSGSSTPYDTDFDWDDEELVAGYSQSCLPPYSKDIEKQEEVPPSEPPPKKGRCPIQMSCVML